MIGWGDAIQANAVIDGGYLPYFTWFLMLENCE